VVLVLFLDVVCLGATVTESNAGGLIFVGDSQIVVSESFYWFLFVSAAVGWVFGVCFVVLLLLYFVFVKCSDIFARELQGSSLEDKVTSFISYPAKNDQE